MKVQSAWSGGHDPSGDWNWTKGAITGPGTLIANGPAAFSSPEAKTLIDNRHLVLNGVTTIADAGSIYAAFTGGVAMTNNGDISIQSDADLIHYSGSPAPVLTNNGSITKVAGDGTTSLGWITENAGHIEAQSGTLQFTGGFTQTDGETVLNYGQVASTTPMLFNGGELKGFGGIAAPVSNSATVTPGFSPGYLMPTSYAIGRRVVRRGNRRRLAPAVRPAERQHLRRAERRAPRPIDRRLRPRAGR